MTSRRNQGVIVRKAKPRDAERINSFDQYFPQLASLSGPKGPFYTQFVAGEIASQASSRKVVLVAEEKGTIVGYAWSNPLLDAGPVVDLDLLAVSPEARRRGIAQALISSSVDAYRRAGFKIAVATVSESSSKAFEKSGWESVPVGHEIQWEWTGASEAWFGPDMLSHQHDRVVFLRLTADAPVVHAQPKARIGAIAK